jgi:hypothetical protein
MVNDQLDKYPQWHYTNVKSGDKRPYPDAWQNTPLTLEQVASTNIGLILGEHSGGVMAIDFDGETAWQWFDEHIGCPIPPTASWTSGKPYRCQMAFTVPPEAWELVKSRKVVTKRPSYPGAGDGEGFEFRWTGGQSVLPPSRLNDGRRYEWIDTSPVAEIPYELLEKWVEECLPKKPIVDDRQEVTIDDLTDSDVDETRAILTRLKRKHPALSYDEWLTVSFGVASHVGTQVAEIILQEFYPEQQRGEYRRLFKAYSASKSPTIGSVVFLAGPDTEKINAIEQTKQKLKQMKEQTNG